MVELIRRLGPMARLVCRHLPLWLLELLPAASRGTVSKMLTRPLMLRVIGRLAANVARFNGKGRVIERELRVVAKRDLLLRLNIAEYTQCGYYFEIPNEPLVRRLLTGGDVFVDIGANVGLFALLGSLEFKHVLAIEPAPESLGRLRSNVSRSEAGNVETIGVAVSDHRGQMRLNYNPLNAGGNSLSPFDPDYVRHSGVQGWDGVDVAVETLDELVASRLAEDLRIGLIKIDVEGHEVPAVRGALGTIERCSSDLFVEVGCSRSKVDELLGLLPPDYFAVDPATGERLGDADRVPFDVFFVRQRADSWSTEP